MHRPDKTTILVCGGPGTGKSVVALHLVGQLAKAGRNAQHATGSRSFTGNVRKVVGGRAANQFKYFNNDALVDHDAVDVLVMDEAHRFRHDVGRGRPSVRVRYRRQRPRPRSVGAHQGRGWQHG